MFGFVSALCCFLRPTAVAHVWQAIASHIQTVAAKGKAMAGAGAQGMRVLVLRVGLSQSASIPIPWGLRVWVGCACVCIGLNLYQYNRGIACVGRMCLCIVFGTGMVLLARACVQ